MRRAPADQRLHSPRYWFPLNRPNRCSVAAHLTAERDHAVKISASIILLYFRYEFYKIVILESRITNLRIIGFLLFWLVLHSCSGHSILSLSLSHQDSANSSLPPAKAQSVNPPPPLAPLPNPPPMHATSALILFWSLSASVPSAASSILRLRSP